VKFFPVDKVREADAYTIANEPVSSIDLMERAAGRLAEWIVSNYTDRYQFLFFAGHGNNGGDAWALARLLWHKGFRNISFYLLDTGRSLSPDSESNRKRLEQETGVQVSRLMKAEDFPEIRGAEIIIDGLFGSGLTRPVEGLAFQLIGHINNSKKKAVIAIDIPSGLFGEDNSGNRDEGIIRADFTLSFQFPKLSFFFPENSEFTGEWSVLPIGIHPEFIQNENTNLHFFTGEDAAGSIKKRKKFSHKGTYGHALLIAGSYGMMGAAVLSARAAVRSGVGLLTVHIPRFGVEIIQTSLPEALIAMDESDIIFTEHGSLDKYSSVAVGPGIDQKPNTKKALIALLREVKVPVVIDADGINLLSSVEKWKDILPGNAILTPHPKEFERLFGTFGDSYSRMKFQRQFSMDRQCIIILKGAYTCITTPGGEVWFNTSGNAGMATGGSGDVLTGIIMGLLAQDYSCEEAAKLGVCLHGMAGDISAECFGQHGLIASDITDNIGRAFCVIEKKKTEHEKN
jgi:NAD(P)H-hydrate epimerase